MSQRLLKPKTKIPRTKLNLTERTSNSALSKRIMNLLRAVPEAHNEVLAVLKKHTGYGEGMPLGGGPLSSLLGMFG